MDPIVLIHGYSAESKQTTSAAIQKIYGTLPQALRDAYGNPWVAFAAMANIVACSSVIVAELSLKFADAIELKHERPLGISNAGIGISDPHRPYQLRAIYLGLSRGSDRQLAHRIRRGPLGDGLLPCRVAGVSPHGQPLDPSRRALLVA
jgi:hypothetical protein